MTHKDAVKINDEINTMIEGLVSKLVENTRRPRRDELIAAIAFAYKVSERTATEWLIKEFQRAA